MKWYAHTLWVREEEEEEEEAIGDGGQFGEIGWEKDFKLKK